MINLSIAGAKTCALGTHKWRDVTLPIDKTIDVRRTRLAYDGYGNIFLTDSRNNAVHILSVGGRYERELLSSIDLSWLSPHALVVDKEQEIVYLGQEEG